ncbi:MAG: MBL fold metallo-hydrolase [Pyramidobacter sp.]
MNEMNRRDFLKGLSVGAIGAFLTSGGIASTILREKLLPKHKGPDIDIGALKGIHVKCISETSWFDNYVQQQDFKKAGGSLVQQYDVKFTHTGVKEGFDGDNAGGYSALVEFEFLNGDKKKILLDTGWNNKWMTKRFEEEGVDQMLRSGEIDTLVISHDHYDHFWGIQTTLQWNPKIKLIIPNSFREESYQLLKGADFPKPPVSNTIPYQGELTQYPLKQVNKIFPGVSYVTFACPCGRGVYGEGVLVCNVEGKGLVTISGCCHMGLLTLLNFTKNNFKGGDKIYGVYGGLHISPYDNWNPANDDLVRSIKSYNVEKLGANHCTGYITVEKMIAAGVPVIKGTARNKTKRDLYLGNGDELQF